MCRFFYSFVFSWITISASNSTIRSTIIIPLLLFIEYLCLALLCLYCLQCLRLEILLFLFLDRQSRDALAWNSSWKKYFYKNASSIHVRTCSLLYYYLSNVSHNWSMTYDTFTYSLDKHYTPSQNYNVTLPLAEHFI